MKICIKKSTTKSAFLHCLIVCYAFVIFSTNRQLLFLLPLESFLQQLNRHTLIALLPLKCPNQMRHSNMHCKTFRSFCEPILAPYQSIHNGYFFKLSDSFLLCFLSSSFSYLTMLSTKSFCSSLSFAYF